MNLQIDNPQDDEISKLLDKMNEELMLKRIELGEVRKTKDPSFEDKFTYIQNLELDFYGILKQHTAYLKFKNATGQGKAKHSETLLAKIRQISSNMGQIVSMIPKPTE